MTLYQRRKTKQPPKRKFPKLYEPRALSACGDPVGTDARWRGVPQKVTIANRLDVLELQREQRDRS